MAYRRLDPTYVARKLTEPSRKVAPYYMHYLGGSGEPKSISDYFKPSISTAIDSALAQAQPHREAVHGAPTWEEIAWLTRGYMSDPNPRQRRVFTRAPNYERYVDTFPVSRMGAMANMLGHFDAIPDTANRRWTINDPFAFHGRDFSRNEKFRLLKQALLTILPYMAQGHTLAPLVVLGNFMGAPYQVKGDIPMTQHQLEQLRKLLPSKRP